MSQRWPSVIRLHYETQLSSMKSNERKLRHKKRWHDRHESDEDDSLNPAWISPNWLVEKRCSFASVWVENTTFVGWGNCWSGRRICLFGEDLGFRSRAWFVGLGVFPQFDVGQECDLVLPAERLVFILDFRQGGFAGNFTCHPPCTRLVALLFGQSLDGVIDAQ